MKPLVLMALLFGISGVLNFQIKQYVEADCVAVLTEAHVEKRRMLGFNDQMPETDGEGNEIVHIPEQTLKLRCR